MARYRKFIDYGAVDYGDLTLVKDGHSLSADFSANEPCISSSPRMRPLLNKDRATALISVYHDVYFVTTGSQIR